MLLPPAPLSETVKSVLVRFVLLSLVLLVAVQPSYVHPDEHHQSLEILARDFAHIGVTVPWEFKPEFAARSIVPLYLYYGPLYFVIFHVIQINNPKLILALVRLQNLIVYLLACKFVFKKFVKRKDITWVKFLLLTSYTTTAIQSHSFSNSIETILLLLTLGLFQQISKPHTYRPNHFWKDTIMLGFLISVGVFNRITFIGFILLPSLLMFKRYYIRHIKLFGVLLLTILSNFCIFILIDTLYFQNNTWTITPWNNLKYNLNTDNLSSHGLHARYTHLLINLPQLVGPILLILPIQRRNNMKFDNLLNLSIMSGLTVLSIFQHQEMRFLIPLVPLILMQTPKCNKKIWVFVWLMFNSIMSLIMSVLHQSGGPRYLIHQNEHRNGDMGIQIWWKNYMPPTWMYMNSNLISSTTNIVDDTERLDNITTDMITNHVIDLKGSGFELLEETIDKLVNDETDLTLIIPSSVLGKIEPLYAKYEILLEYHTFANLDLDHFDMADMTTFIPGLYAFKIETKKGYRD